MDTRCWGFSAWKLLHSITFGYPVRPTRKDQTIYYHFFSSIKNVLPCIFCRNSFDQFEKELPLKDHLDSRDSLVTWLYLMHNKVNDKLRKCGEHDEPDAELDDVKNFYSKYVRTLNNSQSRLNVPGWDFIYCVIFDFPVKKPDAARTAGIIVFFQLLQAVLPFHSFRNYYTDYISLHPIKDVLNNKQAFKRWFYNLEKGYCVQRQLEYRSYSETCKYIDQFKADCSIKNGKPICRAP